MIGSNQGCTNLDAIKVDAGSDESGQAGDWRGQQRPRRRRRAAEHGGQLRPDGHLQAADGQPVDVVQPVAHRAVAFESFRYLRYRLSFRSS